MKTTTTPRIRCIRLRLAHDLYRRLGHEAVDRGTTVTELLRVAARGLVEKRPRRAVPSMTGSADT